MSGTLRVNEIFLSVQGESTFAGLPCIFVRLTGCPLRCAYCDTAHAFHEGRELAVEAVLAEVTRLAEGFPSAPPERRLPLVEVTGGEPLAQAAVHPLLTRLVETGCVVLLETSGALDIAPVDPRVRRILDVKCPSSGEAERNRWENLAHLRPTDEVKFVLGTVEDYLWARRVLTERLADVPCPVLFSRAEPPPPGPGREELKPFPADHTPLSRRELVERLLADRLPVRFQAQLHKLIWPPTRRGV